MARDNEERRLGGGNGTVTTKCPDAETKRLRPDLTITWSARDSEEQRKGAAGQ